MVFQSESLPMMIPTVGGLLPTVLSSTAASSNRFSDNSKRGVDDRGRSPEQTTVPRDNDSRRENTAADYPAREIAYSNSATIESTSEACCQNLQRPRSCMTFRFDL